MLKFSEAAAEVEEWVEMQTGYCDVSGAETIFLDGNYYKFVVHEDEYDPLTFTVTPRGRLININGEDVVEISKSAYDNDPDRLERIKAFEQKWYKE